MNEYKGVPVPPNVVDHAEQNDEYSIGWKDGVDAALNTITDPGVLKITGWAKDAVRAFAHVAGDDTDAARRTVRDMSGRDRAVLAFTISELSRLIDEEESFRRQADRTAARDRLPDTF